MGTATVTVRAEDGSTTRLAVPIPDRPGMQLLVGSSKGSIGIPTVDAKMGRKAAPVRVFEQSIPTNWAATDDLPSDNRVTLTSVQGDIDAWGLGDYNTALDRWIKGSPAGTMAAISHEGDVDVRAHQRNPSQGFTIGQWTKAQEVGLPVVAAAGRIPVAIVTYQSCIDGTVDQYFTPAMRAIPGLVMGVDTYTPGVPSATVPKMVQKIWEAAARLGLPWGIPELGIGLNNGTDEQRAAQVALILQACADHGARFVCYWPKAGEKADYTAGDASWRALAAVYALAA